MKRCFSTLCCLEAAPGQVTEYALAGGMQGVEIRVNEKGETMGGCTAADGKNLGAGFARAGLTVTDLALSCSIREYSAAQIKIGRQGMDFAAAMGAGAVRIFVGAHQNRLSEKVNNDTEGILRAIGELSDYGKEKGVALWLETHSSFSSGKAMRELLDAVQRENVRVIWDVIHSMEYRETPEETAAYLGSAIAHVHLKDGRPGPDADAAQFVHTDLGQGTVPVDRVLAALEKTGYDGFYSLEWESPWRDEIRSLYPDVNDLLASYNRFLDAGIAACSR